MTTHGASTLFTEFEAIAKNLSSSAGSIKRSRKLWIDPTIMDELQRAYFDLLSAIDASIPEEGKDLSEKNINALYLTTDLTIKFLALVKELPVDSISDLKQQEKINEIKKYASQCINIYTSRRLNIEFLSRAFPVPGAETRNRVTHSLYSKIKENKTVGTIKDDIQSQIKKKEQSIGKLQKKQDKNTFKIQLYTSLCVITASLIVSLPLAAIFAYKAYQASKK